MRRTAAFFVLCISMLAAAARAATPASPPASGHAASAHPQRARSRKRARQHKHVSTARHRRQRRLRLRRHGRPRLKGLARQGSILSTSNGSWTATPTSYRYAWEKCDASGGKCTRLRGDASSTYTLTSGDVGHTIRAVVTATRRGGSVRAASAHTGVVSVSQPSPTAPVSGGALNPVGSSSGSVPCALTAAAQSCWASHTGVQGATGYTEAQIEAGASGFTHVTGDVTVTTPNTVIDHEWISGCVSIASSATNVTIKDSLIATGNECKGGDGQANPSAINNGNLSGGNGLLVEDTTVDGLNTVGDTYGISMHDGECLRCNALGFDKLYNASQNTTIQDSYGHDINTNDACAHDNDVWFDTAQNNKVEHSYMIATGGQVCGAGIDIDGAISIPSDYGPPNHDTVDDSYADGVSGVDLHLSCNGSTYQVITNNALDGQAKSYADVWPTGTGNTWSGNYDPSNNASASPPGPPSC